MKLPTRSRETAREALNVAAESATRSSALAVGARLASLATAPKPVKKVPTIAAWPP